MKPELMNALALAYLGDAVFDVYIREYLLMECHIYKPQLLQKAAVQYVSAKAQTAFMHYAMENDLLSEEELSIFKRGRNAKPKGRSVKHKTISEHNQSTGFEALVATLYLNEEKDRLDQIVRLFIDYVTLNNTGNDK